MASKKNIEMYETPTKYIVSEDEIYDTISECKSEHATERNNMCSKAEQAKEVSYTCKNNVLAIFIAVLYAIVLAMIGLFAIFWCVYSEENRKVNLMSMKAVVENIKTDLGESNSSLDNLKGVTDEINTTCQNGLSDLSKKFADLEKQIKYSSLSTENSTIAFNVMNAENVTSQNAIKFAKIILNEGNAYNEDTGTFIAPRDGIYLFNAHICCVKDKEVDYYIMVNSIAIVTGEFRVPDGATDNKCTSFSAVALVQKGDSVRVGGMQAEDVADYSDDFCSFSGTLIQKI